MSNCIDRELNLAKNLALTLRWIALPVVPVVVGTVIIAAVWAQSPLPTQSGSTSTSKFEVASIKPCKDATTVGKPGRGGNGSSNLSSGRFVVNCRTVKTLLEMAFTSGMPPLPPIEGGPSWINSERYSINAEAVGNPSAAVMKGPMLQSLLAERFQLKTHLESRDDPA